MMCWTWPGKGVDCSTDRVQTVDSLMITSPYCTDLWIGDCYLSIYFCLGAMFLLQFVQFVVFHFRSVLISDGYC